MNNPLFIMQRFNEFKSQFKGNPQQMVEQLLREGKMTNEQFQQLQEQAKQFQQLLR